VSEIEEHQPEIELATNHLLKCSIGKMSLSFNVLIFKSINFLAECCTQSSQNLVKQSTQRIKALQCLGEISLADPD